MYLQRSQICKNTLTRIHTLIKSFNLGLWIKRNEDIWIHGNICRRERFRWESGLEQLHLYLLYRTVVKKLHIRPRRDHDCLPFHFEQRRDRNQYFELWLIFSTSRKNGDCSVLMKRALQYSKLFLTLSLEAAGSRRKRPEICVWFARFSWRLRLLCPISYAGTSVTCCRSSGGGARTIILRTA